MTVDHRVRREETLRLPRRFEPLHLALSTPRRPVRVLCPIVEISACSVPHIGQHLSLRDAVAPQPIGHNASGLVAEPGQQAPEEALRGRGGPPLLNEDAGHDPVLVHRAPEIEELAVDPQYTSSRCQVSPGLGRRWRSLVENSTCRSRDTSAECSRG